MEKICSVKECKNIVHGRGLCDKHYKKWQRYKDPLYTQLHHKTNTRSYSSWEHMNQRCNNVNHKHYKHYGGRGIKICERWKDFKKFYADMGDRPKNLQLDRIDNNGNYEPGNCRWVTSKINNNNKRHNIYGRKLTIKQVQEIRKLYPTHRQWWIAKRYNIGRQAVSDIVNYKTWKYA